MSTETLDPLDAQVIPLRLPVQVPRQTYRKAQSNIPDDKQTRVRLKKFAEDHVTQTGAVPPLTMDELVEHTTAVLDQAGLDPIYRDYTSILVSNAAWRESLAQIPYNRRLLLVPKCLRVEDKCPAPFDEFGLLCKECGLCSIQDLTVEAERLGYAVLVAEGSAIVRSMIETGKIEAIVGVSCINVLEKCFPHMEAAAIPGVAIPLLQDDCINTTVDLDWVWDLIHLTSDDKTYRLDLDTLKTTVRGWFEPHTLDRIMGAVETDDDTARIARDYLQKGGKRWRPYLAACTYMALESDRQEEPALTEDVRKAAIAIECFHKASLIHDDIEDGDERRYDSPALHAEVGIPVALNIGDFLVGEGYRLLGELGHPELTTIAAEGHVTLSRGQGRELLWARNPQPLPSMRVLEIFRQKTAAAFEVALRIGATLGRADNDTHDVLRKYSEALGIAYQIKDDLDDFKGVGDSNDLEQVRLSLILAIAHKRAEGTDRERIDSVIQMGAGELPEDVHRIVDSCGVLDKTEDLLEAYKEDAIRSLRFLSSPTLKGLMRRIVGKIFGETLIEGYCSEFEARNAAGRAAGAEAASGSL
ncbi:MAG: polyprenyl synthetase family protein [Acidobacteriota bacterium]|nr:polyprenyl synthetase family protein [Acidobacteriota bacterium]